MRRKNKKQTIEKILVESYAAEGKSISRVDGKVLFIENVIPGDVVDVLLLKNKKDWGEGIVTRFHEYSKNRISPFCNHFNVCGGCRWQMLPYEKQLQYKQQQVEEQLKRIGKIDLPPVQPIIGAERNVYYRNKIEYTFGNKRYLLKEELKNENITGNEDVAGFHAKGVFDKVVDIEQCYLQEEPTNAIRNWVKEFGRAHNFSFYDIKQHSGFLRTMQIRICTTGEIMANIVLGTDEAEKRELLMGSLLKAFPSITTLLYTINTKHNDSLYDLTPQVYHGKGYVQEKLGSFYFNIGPKSFFQTNTYQAEKLYQATLELSQLTGKETVYDLYCGTGSIGIFVSSHAKKIIGVETIKEAVDDAKKNAEINKINHAEFFVGDVIDICNNNFFSAHGKPDVIITDPPRAGMHEKLVNKILEIEAPRVVYVSCNVSTQARDLQLLNEKYTVVKIQPVDMFPHTHHIENVVALQLR
ncbi:MAG TPA: 23S rRNA (uracil(1939)-C(5))-methyltransferase RlmD [Chitinophagaceae bacterium]|nr:23S rRNA (uracil(1939)-C(5))-methyltransferase RlmD [Chitinophagaceae bacterium]